MSIVFLLGFTLRVVPAVAASGSRNGSWRLQEPVRVALSLAATGAFHDAYGPGTGPTAHCAPLYPLMLALLFRIFGTGTAGYIAMTMLGCAGAAASFAMLPVLAVAAALGAESGIAAGLAGALLPVNFAPQADGTFEAPFTAWAIIILCIVFCSLWRTKRFSVRNGAKSGFTSGAAFLLSPGLIPVVATVILFSCVRFRNHLPRILMYAAVVSGCALIVLLPWAVRNRIALGSFIWTRSNFGLELSSSNNDLATADDEFNLRTAWYPLAHPASSDAERARVRALGEVAYHRMRGAQAKEWINTHRRRFLQLTVERFRLFWFPNMARIWQSVAEIALTILSFAGLVVLFRKGRDFAWIATAVLVSYPAVYLLVQVSPRYRFPVEPLMFLLGACCLLPLTNGAKAEAATLRD